MGLTIVQIDTEAEVHVKDNVYADDGWHLWMSLYIGGFRVGDLGDIEIEDRDFAVVPDLEDATIEAAARAFHQRFEPNVTQ